jgi:hypothetical protein
MSNQRFQKGDVCIVAYDSNSVVHPAYECYQGIECIIEEERVAIHDDGSVMHHVRFGDGVRGCCSESVLRGRPPPTDTLDTATPLKVTRWADCPFKPQGVKA